MTPTPARALLHFALLGTALFAGAHLLRGGSPAPEIVLDAPAREALRAEGEALFGRAPDAREWEALVASWVEEEILVREARALGLERGDPVIRQRLLRNLRFVGEDGGPEGASEEALLARARELGMDESDVVVRRRLAERMRARVEAAARAWEPPRAELEAHLAAHPERFAVPRRVAFEHVFLASARRADAEGDVRALLAAAARGAAPPEGDPFLAPRHQPLQTETSLARYFGADFAAALFALPRGAWSGPVASPGGVHLVRVLEARPAELPELGSVLPAVRDALRSERAERDVARFLAESRPRYAVVRPPGD